MTNTQYETDYCVWAETNAKLLRQGQLAEVDIVHIIEELEDVGKSERRSLQSYMEIVLLHLLKWKYQPRLRSLSWRSSIENGRQGLEKILDDSPSLRSTLPNVMDRAYVYAKRSAVAETGLSHSIFPTKCPFELTEVMNEVFLPHAEIEELLP
ncbi:MAG: hypothetical protein BWK79_13335 [Beggiatoa sp. IS2]|nr:MAG: hypothetical protein BWK79_13335 [Beggiatoa sp. IS2]